jgi:hypothetical protein
MSSSSRPERTLDTISTSPRQALNERVVPAIDVAHYASGLLRPGGSFITIDDARGDQAHHGVTAGAAVTSAMSIFIAALAAELAPARANTIIIDSGGRPARHASGRAGRLHLVAHPPDPRARSRRGCGD